MKKIDRNTISPQPVFSDPDSKNGVTIPVDLRFSDMDANGHLFLVIISLFLIPPFLSTLKLSGSLLTCSARIN